MSRRSNRSESVDELLKKYEHKSVGTSSRQGTSSRSSNITVSSSVRQGTATSVSGVSERRPQVGELGTSKTATTYSSIYRRQELATSVPSQQNTLVTPSSQKGNASTHVGGSRFSSQPKTKEEDEDKGYEVANDIKFTGRTEFSKSQLPKKNGESNSKLTGSTGGVTLATGSQTYTTVGGDSSSRYSGGASDMSGLGEDKSKRNVADRAEYGRKGEDFATVGVGGGASGVCSKAPELRLDQPDSMDSQSRFSGSSSGDLISYNRQSSLPKPEDAISMGTSAKLVPSSLMPLSDQRHSSYKFDGKQCVVTHNAMLSSGKEPTSQITPQGSMTSSGLGRELRRYDRSSSSPASNVARDLKDSYSRKEDELGVLSPESASSQAVGDESGEHSRVLLANASINTVQLNKSMSHNSSGSESRGEIRKQWSSSSQSSRESKKHLMYGGKNYYPVDSIGHMLSGSSGERCSEVEEMKKQHEAELNQKDVEILSLREQLGSLKKTIDLLNTDHSRDPDSYFNEITSLTTQLTANQVELGELKVNMAGYEELKRRSKPLEEQASSTMKMFMELQQENEALNEALKLANIRGTEGESYEGEDYPGFSPSLSSTAKQNESTDIESMKTSLVLYENKVEEIRSEWKEAQQKVAILEREVTSKDNVIKKLKDRVNMLTVPVGSAEELRRSLPPSGGQIHPARLQEAEVEIERLRGQLENAGGGAEIVGELEAENEQLHKRVKELKEDLAKSQGKAEEMMNHLANVAEQTKTIRSSMMMRESEINRLQEENQSLVADKDALTDLLSKADRKKSQINERLQESEKERAEWEIRAGRLEQLVEETRRVFDGQNEELSTTRKQLTEKCCQLEQERAVLEAIGREKMTLADQVSLHEQTAIIFEQDFRQERRDREQAHSKFIETEDRYKHQLDSLSAESQKIMEELKRQKKQSKDLESEYQARLSQLSYATGERDKIVAVLEARNRELEGDIATKTQQLKQYKKQADHLRDDLVAHKEVHETQKSQVELFANDREALQREVAKLQHENKNLQARVTHAVATNKSGSLTTVSDQKRIKELEEMVEALHFKTAQLQSQLEVQPFNKAALSSSQAPPVYSSAASTTTSSSRDRQKMSALPSRVRPGPVKAQSMEEDLLNSRGNNSRNKLDQGSSNMDRLTRTPRAGVHQTRDDFQYGQRLHLVQDQQRRSLTSLHNPATNADFARPSNVGVAGGMDALATPFINTGTSGSRPGVHPSGQYRQHHAAAGLQLLPAGVSRAGMNNSLPPGVSSGRFNPASTSSSSGHAPSSTSSSHYPTPATTSGIPRTTATPYQLNIPHPSSTLSTVSPLYSPGGYSTGMSGPSSLPGSNLPPMPPPGGQFHPPHNAPLRAQHEQGFRAQSHQFAVSGRDQNVGDGTLAGQDSVEKDSPPSSLSEQGGPRSLNLSASLPLSRQNYPGQDRHGHQAPLNHGRVGGGAQVGGRGGYSKGLHSEQDLVMMMGRGTGRSQPPFQQGQGVGHSVSASRLSVPRTSAASSHAEVHNMRPLQETAPSASPQQVQESLSDTSANISPNQLEEGIDDEIVEVAGQVGGAKGAGGSSDNAPIDPNLECPTCGLPFRIGQIQAFREHASTCLRKMT